MRPTQQSYEKQDELAREEYQPNLRSLLGRPENAYTSLEYQAQECHYAVRQRILSQGAGIPDVHQQSHAKSHADTDMLRLVDAPVEYDQSDEVRPENHGHACKRQQIQHKRKKQAKDNERAFCGQEQFLLRLINECHFFLASSSRA
jgi:hypothetical protein